MYTKNALYTNAYTTLGCKRRSKQDPNAGQNSIKIATQPDTTQINKIQRRFLNMSIINAQHHFKTPNMTV